MRLDLSPRRGGSVGDRGAPARAAGGPALGAGESSVPAGRVGSRGLKEVRHYENASSEFPVRHHWALES